MQGSAPQLKRVTDRCPPPPPVEGLQGTMRGGLLQDAKRHAGHAALVEVALGCGEDATKGIEAASGTTCRGDRDNADVARGVEVASRRDDGIGEEDAEGRCQGGEPMLLVAEDESRAGSAIRQGEVQGSWAIGIELTEKCGGRAGVPSHRREAGAAQGTSGRRAQDTGPTEDEVRKVRAPFEKSHATTVVRRGRRSRVSGAAGEAGPHLWTVRPAGTRSPGAGR